MSSNDDDAPQLIPTNVQEYSRLVDDDGDVWLVPEHVRPAQPWEVPTEQG